MTTESALTATDAALGSRDLAARDTRTAIPRARPVPAGLRCTTREIADPGDLVGLLPSAADALSWVRGGEGLVAWGRTTTLETGGPGRFVDAEAVWRALAARIEVDDEVGLPGTGPVAFASFAFGDGPLGRTRTGGGERSVLVVPRVVVGRRGGRCWITELGPVAGHPAPWGDVAGDPARLGPDERPAPVRRPGPAHWAAGAMSAAAYRDAVAEAVTRMADGPLDKVVLARDVVARFGRPVDPRFLIRALAAGNPRCWTYSVDGLVGATPELLLRRSGAVVESRVLAGTTWPGAEGADDQVLSAGKYREEHRFAVESLCRTLGPSCTRMELDGPHLLRLPTVTHLATDVRGHLDPLQDPSVLALAGAVHPTAAVGGTPPALAAATIAELEGRVGLQRGRYAGPVGWVDVHGDGELGIALRCARLSGRTARLFAGCGVVADSDPDLELAETAAKLRAVTEALGS
ncbi:chorismate-binding protein [Pseudonocardia sp. NPDC049154]|uniref:isochorismate synthase n=1 Tax=Pseudonocardia sp. NPDC049154 TaxID=3155501 RepID=UPI0033F112D4